MKTDHWWAPLAGVGFVLVAILGFIVSGEPPEASKPAQEIADFYRDNDSSVTIGAALLGVAATLLVFFAGVLRRELRRAEGEGGTLSLIAFGGAAIFAVGAGIDGTILFALAEASDDLQPAQIQTVQAVWDNDFLPMAIGLQVLFLATGLSILRHGALPKWLGWIAVILGVVAVTPIGFVAFMVGGIWILIVSIVLAMRGRSRDAPPAQPAATGGV